MSIVGIRRARNLAVVALATLMTAFALGLLGSVLYTLVGNGIAALSPTLFTESTPPPGSDGGLANAIVGSLIMTGLGLGMALPLGILAGTWLAEIGRGPFADGVRFLNDMLLAAPSIIIGLFIYVVLVVPMRHFSAMAGAAALALIALPIIVRTTEDGLRLVPNPLREAAAALGAPRWVAVVKVSWRAAFQPILTGVLLAVARISGETAPLLFTALNNQFWSTDLNAPMANLPVVIFQFAMSPYADWRDLAWAGAFLITLAVLGLTITARLLTAPRQRTS